MGWMLLMFVLGDLEPVGVFDTKEECVEAGKASEGWTSLSNGDWVQKLGRGFICVQKQSS